MFDTTSSEETSDVDSAKELDTSSNRDEENDADAHMEERVGLDGEKEKAIRAIIQYYDSLYFKDSIVGEKTNENTVPSVNEFESFMGFLSMVNDQEIVDGCKDLVKEHFENLVKWFYEVIMHCEERPTPVKINDQDVSLLDLYLTVKGLGGHARVTIKNSWIEVAYAMGFQRQHADCLREYYTTHLSLLAAYYDVARNYSSGDYVPKALECRGTSRVVAADVPIEETMCEVGSKEENVECVDEGGIEGKIEYDDGEYLIISFEENEGTSEAEENAENRNGEDAEGSADKEPVKMEDYIIVD